MSVLKATYVFLASDDINRVNEQHRRCVSGGALEYLSDALLALPGGSAHQLGTRRLQQYMVTCVIIISKLKHG